MVPGMHFGMPMQAEQWHVNTEKLLREFSVI